MKKGVISLVLLIFLTGCDASSEIERGMALRSSLLRSGGSFDARITADYGDKSYAFTMNCAFDETGDMTFTVAEPETIAGITGTVTDEGGALTFDDTALQFDLMADDQLSPVSAPWMLLKTLRSGCLTSACEEEDALYLTFDDSYEDDALHVDVWLKEENIPARAEIVYDGRRILSMDVENFVIL